MRCQCTVGQKVNFLTNYFNNKLSFVNCIFILKIKVIFIRRAKVT